MAQLENLSFWGSVVGKVNITPSQTGMVQLIVNVFLLPLPLLHWGLLLPFSRLPAPSAKRSSFLNELNSLVPFCFDTQETADL